MRSNGQAFRPIYLMRMCEWIDDPRSPSALVRKPVPMVGNLFGIANVTL
jgi:hypothetical protein